MSDPNEFRGPVSPHHDPHAWRHDPFFQPAYAPPSSGLSIASLVCGILAWTAAPVLCAVVAIITGHMALGEIRRDPKRVGGRGLAVVGMLLGYAQMLLIAIVVAVVALIAFVAISGAPAIRETVNVRADAPPAAIAPTRTIAASGDDIDRRVASVLAPIAKVPVDMIDPSDALADDLKLRDTDRIDLIVKLEEEFRVKLRPGESQTWKTAADVARSIRERERPAGSRKDDHRTAPPEATAP